MVTLSPHLPALATTLANGPLASVHAVAIGQHGAHTSGGTVVGVALVSATLLAASVGPLVRFLTKLLIVAMGIGLVAILIAVFLVADTIASH